MTPDEKAELRKAAEAATCCDQESNFRYLVAKIGAVPRSLLLFINIARPRSVLALLDENARLAAEVERLPKWILCAERMPRDGYRVLGLYQSFGGPRVVPVVHDGSEEDRLRWTADGGTQYGVGIITHWMPLPEPPK